MRAGSASEGKDSNTQDKKEPVTDLTCGKWMCLSFLSWLIEKVNVTGNPVNCITCISLKDGLKALEVSVSSSKLSVISLM